MGRYSSSDEEYNRKLKKKKKRRSRSGSSSDTKYSSTSKYKKSKRKHKHRSRSTSRSEDRYSKRERSVERGRRSRSRGRRSRSPERRRSRSLNRNRRSRSYSRGRRSRSDSRSRYSGRKRSSSPDRSRRSSSGSGSKSRSRRSSPDRRKVQGSGFLTTDSLSRSESNTLDSIPGFSDMTPAEQAQARLKMALKAAAMADGKLKEQAMTSQSSAMDPIDSRNFSDAVALIESDGFLPAAFKSSRTSRSYKDGKDGAIDHSSHDLAMFGAVGSSVIFSKTEPLDKTALDDNPESIFDASLLCDPEEKMKRWVQKLTIMRKKKLEGDVLPY